MNAIKTSKIVGKIVGMIALVAAVLAGTGSAIAAELQFGSDVMAPTQGVVGDENLRCEARALQIEAKVLRCVGACRSRAERRHSFNEERCLSRCEVDYDASFARLQCPADRRLVRSLDAAGASELLCEARVLQDRARSLRCVARCENSSDPGACAADCSVRYGESTDASQCEQ